ncbi:MAG: hypothetical protein MUF34_30215 [Polyangiaceae bacterium]|nr:hypothetical protein [Polyangiaceae bacterium]
MKRSRSFPGLIAAFALAFAPAAMAAPPADKTPDKSPDKGGARDVHVVHVASSSRDAYEALKLTKALEQRVLASRGVRLVNSNKSLLALLDQVKCGQAFTAKSLDKGGAGLNDRAGEDVDTACLGKVAVPLGAPFDPAERFFWGWVYRDAAAKPMVTLNFWDRAQGERKVSLPLAEPFDRLADRLIQHLVYPGRVGDVRVASARTLRGELFVGTDSQGRFEGETIELTLPVGAHSFELRQGEKVLARGRGVVLARESRQVELEAVEASPVAAAPPTNPVIDAPPPLLTKRGPSPWAWVTGGVGVAGLAGAGVLFALRQSAESDLNDQCSSKDNCPETARDTLDRSNLYGTLAPISLGVGVLGLSASAYFFMRPQPTRTMAAPPRIRITGGAAPLAGGGAAFLFGSF